MPAALTVDQRLVDDYLARVNRFFENVGRFEQQLKDMTSAVKERITPTVHQMAEPAYEKPVASQPKQAVVTADDINIEDLLRGVNFDSGLSV